MAEHEIKQFELIDDFEELNSDKVEAEAVEIISKRPETLLTRDEKEELTMEAAGFINGLFGIAAGVATGNPVGLLVFMPAAYLIGKYLTGMIIEIRDCTKDSRRSG